MGWFTTMSGVRRAKQCYHGWFHGNAQCREPSARIYPVDVAAIGLMPLYRAGACTLILMQGASAQSEAPTFSLVGTLMSGPN
jgi:hypothetical protein